MQPEGRLYGAGTVRMTSQARATRSVWFACLVTVVLAGKFRGLPVRRCRCAGPERKN